MQVLRCEYNMSLWYMDAIDERIYSKAIKLARVKKRKRNRLTWDIKRRQTFAVNA